MWLQLPNLKAVLHNPGASLSMSTLVVVTGSLPGSGWFLCKPGLFYNDTALHFVPPFTVGAATLPHLAAKLCVAFNRALSASLDQKRLLRTMALAKRFPMGEQMRAYTQLWNKVRHWGYWRITYS